MKVLLAFVTFVAGCSCYYLMGLQTSPQVFLSASELAAYIKNRQQKSNRSSQASPTKLPSGQTKKTTGKVVVDPLTLPQQMRTNETDPYQKIYDWAISDPLLNDTLLAGSEFSEDQQLKISQYMANSLYFQQQLIEQLVITPSNKWVDKLPPSAQVRYLKILSNLKKSYFSNIAKKKQMESLIYKDYDIEPVYKKFIKQNPTANPLKSGYQLIASNYI